MLNLRDITAPLVENKAYLFSFLWPTKSFKYCIINRKFLSSDLIGGIPNLSILVIFYISDDFYYNFVVFLRVLYILL